MSPEQANDEIAVAVKAITKKLRKKIVSTTEYIRSVYSTLHLSPASIKQLAIEALADRVRMAGTHAEDDAPPTVTFTVLEPVSHQPQLVTFEVLEKTRFETSPDHFKTFLYFVLEDCQYVYDKNTRQIEAFENRNDILCKTMELLKERPAGTEVKDLPVEELRILDDMWGAVLKPHKVEEAAAAD